MFLLSIITGFHPIIKVRNFHLLWRPLMLFLLIMIQFTLYLLKLIPIGHLKRTVLTAIILAIIVLIVRVTNALPIPTTTLKQANALPLSQMYPKLNLLNSSFATTTRAVMSAKRVLSKKYRAKFAKTAMFMSLVTLLNTPAVTALLPLPQLFTAHLSLI